MNETPRANRVHIGLYGRRNAGKSSLINALTNQDVAIVSDAPGTTTDPVYKAMEILPLGPVVFVDTAGLDDEGALGQERIKRSMDALDKMDIVLIVLDARMEQGALESDIIRECKERSITYFVVHNQSDLVDASSRRDGCIYVSAKTGEGILELRESIAKSVPKDVTEYPIIADMLNKNDVVVLVIPVDSAAPKGRIILPQQQTMREVLDCNACVISCQDTELKETLDKLKDPPRMVVTDSQAFKQVAKIVPESVQLTSFSILFARHKGVLRPSVDGLKAIDSLQDGDRVLISEGCTHHRQCEDIGTVKIPKWLGDYTQKTLEFDFSSGGGFVEDLGVYKLVIHCGACMLSPRTMQRRIAMAQARGVPITNYGTFIAHVHGILPRCLDELPY